MSVTVYIELVFINNFVVDVFLAVATLTVFRKKVKWWRVIVSGILGASVACAYPLMSTAWQIVVKILLAPLLVLVFDKVSEKSRAKRRIYVRTASRVKPETKADKKSRTKREIIGFFKRLFVFCLATYFVGGIVFGIDFAFGIDLASYWQFAVIFASLLTLLIVVRIAVAGLSKKVRKICDVNVKLNDFEIQVKGLCDTGNALTDSLSGLPVVILSKSAEDELTVDSKLIEGYISVTTVGGESEMPIVRLDEVDVKGKNYSAYAALARRDFDDFELILQNTMF